MPPSPTPTPTTAVTYFPGAVTNVAAGEVYRVPFHQLHDLVLGELATDDRKKAAAGYLVPTTFGGDGRRNNANARPTNLAYVDWDDGAGLDEALLVRAGLAVFAHTSDSHSAAAPKWHVFVLLDREYSAAEFAAAVCPWPGAHLRALSQPAYVPTMGEDIEWFFSPGRALALADEWPAPAPEPTPPGPAWAPPARRTAPSAASTNALVTRWLTRPEGTNRLAGALGAALAEWGWEDDEVHAYVEAWFGEADPRWAKHADDAVRGARKRRAGDRIVGFPTLAEELGRPYDAEAAPRGAAAADIEALYVELGLAVAEAPAAAPSAADAAAPEDRTGWGFISGAAVAAWEPPPVPWVCEALCLAPGAPGLITGYGGSGKTTFVQHLALCVASGQKLLGEFPVRLGAVTHLDWEQGADLTKRRYQQLGVTDLPAEALARLRFAALPERRLTDDDALQAVLRAAAGQTLLVVDSLVAATSLDDENAADARRPLDLLGRVSDLTGCTVLVIHHSKKDRSNGRTSARGSSALTDAVSVHLTYEKDDELGVASPATLTLQKVRHILPPGALAEGLVVGQSGAGRLVAVASPADVQAEAVADAERRAVALFSTGWGGRAEELAPELKLRRGDTLALVKTLLDQNVIKRDEKSRVLTLA